MSISSITTRSKTKLKVVLLGDQSVGKTSVIERYMHDRFEEVEDPTIGVDFVVSNVVRGGKQYRLQLWDTAGQERFKSLIPSYLKDSTCCLVMYDVGVESSAENVRSWIQMYSEHKDESAFIVVVGNKIDVKKFPKQEEKKESFVKQGFQHFQVSAKTGEGVKELFDKVIHLSEQGLKKDILFKEILEVEESQDKKQGEVEKKLVDIEEGCTANIIKLDTVAKNKEKSPKKNNKNRNCC